MSSRIAPTEQQNPRTVDIDTVDTRRALDLLLNEDAVAIQAARGAADQLARVVDEAHSRLRLGGAVHYFGAGASGRLAVLDATEITPTFGAPRELFTAHFPGGSAAVADSSLDHEDAEAMGATDAVTLDNTSVAIGVTASGSTPYVAGALRAARRVGALSVLITCNPDAQLRELADISVVADTGPEALTGSTRLKAGTATKVILNSFSTALMIKSGRTYRNLMVGLVASNAKLRERSVRLLADATGESAATCRDVLAEADAQVPEALVRLLAGCSLRQARDAFREHESVRRAVAALTREGA